MNRALRVAALALLAAAALAGCGRAPGEPDAVLRVFAAASLGDAFAAVERGFEAAHPGVDVRIATAGSQVLRLQIEQGAAADVFASADPRHLAALHAAGLAEAPQVFAANALVVVVPADNPAQITAFEQLAAARSIVLGDTNVPVGAYTDALLARAPPALAAAVRARVVSREANVRLVRAKVELGQADAAIVYASDAHDAPRLRAVAIPAALNVPVRYGVAALPGGGQPGLAAAFVAYLRGSEGAVALRSAGLTPEPP